MSKREEDYNDYGIKDPILEELEKQNINIFEYLEGSIAKYSMNDKEYKIFKINNIKELKLNIKEIEEEQIRTNIISEYEKKGIQINQMIEGWRIIARELDKKIEKIKSFVIQKYKINDTLEKQGFVDLVYNKNGYRIAPKKVGRPTEKEKNIRLNVRITESQNKKIKEYAEKFDLTISAALREILEMGIIRSRF